MECCKTSSIPTAEKGDSVSFTFVLEYKHQGPQSFQPDLFSESNPLNIMEQLLCWKQKEFDQESTEMNTESNIPFLSSSSDSTSDDSFVSNNSAIRSKLRRNAKQNHDAYAVNNSQKVSTVSLSNSVIEIFVKRIALSTDSTISLGEIEQLLFQNKSKNSEIDMIEERSFETKRSADDDISSDKISASLNPKRNRQRSSSRQQDWETMPSTPKRCRTSRTNHKFRTPVSEASTLFVPLSTPSKHTTPPTL